MNRNFGRVENGRMTFAPDTLRIREKHTESYESYQEYDEEGNGIGEPTQQTRVWYTTRISHRPTAEEYAMATPKYLPNEYTLPAPPEGQHVASWEWQTDGEKNFKAYTYADDEPAREPVCTLSKLKCYSYLKGMTVPQEDGSEVSAWDMVYGWLIQNDLWTAFTLANDISTDHPQFVQGFATFKEMLGLTDEQAKAFIDGCIMED